MESNYPFLRDDSLLSMFNLSYSYFMVFSSCSLFFCKILFVSLRSPHSLLRVLRSFFKLSIVTSFSEMAVSYFATLAFSVFASDCDSLSCVFKLSQSASAVSALLSARVNFSYNSLIFRSDYFFCMRAYLPNLQAAHLPTFSASSFHLKAVSWGQRWVFKGLRFYPFLRSVPPQFKSSFCSARCTSRFVRGWDRWWLSRDFFASFTTCSWWYRGCDPVPPPCPAWTRFHFSILSACGRFMWPACLLFPRQHACIFRTPDRTFLFLFPKTPELFWSASRVPSSYLLVRQLPCIFVWWYWPGWEGGTSLRVLSSSIS